MIDGKPLDDQSRLLVLVALGFYGMLGALGQIIKRLPPLPEPEPEPKAKPAFPAPHAWQGIWEEWQVVIGLAIILIVCFGGFYLWSKLVTPT